jgi:hypothetical protein
MRYEMEVNLFKRWRRSRSEQASELAPPSPSQPTTPTPASASPPGSTPRTRRPSTMGRTSAEQAYLAQAAFRAKHE